MAIWSTMNEWCFFLYFYFSSFAYIFQDITMFWPAVLFFFFFFFFLSFKSLYYEILKSSKASNYDEICNCCRRNDWLSILDRKLWIEQQDRRSFWKMFSFGKDMAISSTMNEWCFFYFFIFLLLPIFSMLSLCLCRLFSF